MNKCIGIFGWLFGHKFSGRYHEERGEFPVNLRAENVHLDALELMISGSKTYITDVCERCGSTKGPS